MRYELCRAGDAFGNQPTDAINKNYKTLDTELTTITNTLSGQVGVTGDFPALTDNLDGTISVSACKVRLRATEDHKGIAYQYDLEASGILSLTDEDTNYVCIKYNGGTPIYFVTIDLEEVTFSDVIPVFTIYRQGTELHHLSWGNFADGLASRLLDRSLKTNRFEREEYDGLWISEYGTRNIAVSEGTVWYGVTRQDIPAFESHTNLLRLWYHVGGVWTEVREASYRNTYYDNGTDLVEIGGLKYTVAWVFSGIHEGMADVYYILGSEYTNIAQAEAAPIPTDLPEIVRKHTILVGRLIIQKTQPTAIKLNSAFSGSFPVTTVITDGVVIRQKLISGTTGDAQGNSVNLVHGLDSTKILHVTGLVTYAAGYKVPQEHSGTAGYQFSVLVDPTDIVVKNSAANSSNILSKPVNLTITYSE